MPRQALLHEMGLPDRSQLIVAMLSRLSPQKGLDLVDSCLKRLVSLDLDLILLGRDDTAHEAMVRSWQQRFPQWIRTILRYDEPSAHRLIAGADLLLMPSRYEPCGLSQLHAMR